MNPTAQPAQSAAPMPTMTGSNIAMHAATPTYASASLYVGDLHPDITETQLFEIFKQVGQVASIRVCRDAITKRSLGYAYINYHNVQDAERALDLLNYKEIKGKSCRIMWSQRDPSLRRSGAGNIFIKNLDKAITSGDLYDTFSTFGNILSCKVATDEHGNSKGFAFVHFETGESAEQAIGKVNNMQLKGKIVYVGKFLPKKDRSDGTSGGGNKFTNIYVRNLDKSISDEKFLELFNQFGTVTNGLVMRDEAGASKGFGFVNYETAESAQKAVEEMNGKKIGEKDVYVGRAQKKEEREKMLRDMFEKIKRERMNKYQGVNLYVKYLEDTITEEQLRQEFSHCGTITSCVIMKDIEKSVSKGFGFVCFSTPEEATKALTDMNGKMLGSKPIYVALAQRKEQRRLQLEAQHAQRAAGIRLQQAQAAGMPGGGPMFAGGAPVFYPPGPRGFVYPGVGAPMPGMPPRGRYPGPPQVQGQPGQPRQQYQMPFVVGPGGAPGVPPGAGGMPPQGRPPNRGMKGMRSGGPGVAGAQPRPGGQPQIAGAPGATANGGPAPDGMNGVPRRPGYPGFKYNPNVRNQQMPVDQVQPGGQMPSAEDRKQMVGETLYQMIAPALKGLNQEPLTGKITGMLLESLELSELAELVEQPDALNKKINEALHVLEEHDKTPPAPAGAGAANGNTTAPSAVPEAAPAATVTVQ